jgi:hypothetical protein
VTPLPSPDAIVHSLDAARAERRRIRDQERASDIRPLDAWERYRALTDHYEHIRDEAEHIDRTTRFALIILGGLNGINLAIVVRGGEIGLRVGVGGAMTAYLASYALLSLLVLGCAISALRPRRPPAPAGGTPSGTAFPVRQDASMLDTGVEDYCRRWAEVRVVDLNWEVAAMAHAGATMADMKRRALTRVYVGLYVLVGLTAGLLLRLAAAIPGW